MSLKEKVGGVGALLLLCQSCLETGKKKTMKTVPSQLCFRRTTVFDGMQIVRTFWFVARVDTVIYGQLSGKSAGVYISDLHSFS